jgi:hypothetical protein
MRTRPRPGRVLVTPDEQSHRHQRDERAIQGVTGEQEPVGLHVEASSSKIKADGKTNLEIQSDTGA